MIDESGDVCCDRCGKKLEKGEYPFCPHGFGGTAMARDEIPGGQLFENYGPNPIRFDSHSERRRYMRAHDLQETEKFSPQPGTDVDPAGIPNPKGYMDPQTFQNATALILRAQQTPLEKEFDALDDGVLKDFYEGHLTNRDAVAIASGNARRQSRVGRRMK